MKRFLSVLFILGFIGFCEAAQPDLTFVGISPQVSSQAGTIIIRVNVINVGSSATSACKGNVLVDGAVQKVFDIPSLAAPSSPPTSANQKVIDLTVPSAAGPHNVEIRLDADNQNSESNEGNNTASRSVTVPASFSLTVITSQHFGSGNVVGKLEDGTTVITCAIQPPATCTQQLSQNSKVTLNATPATGHTFFGWKFGTGSASACTGTAPCTFTLAANSQVSAVFEPPSILTLRVTGPGKATFIMDNGANITCQSGFTLAEPFLPNSQVTLNAVPASGSIFSGWTVVSGSPAGAMCNLSATPCSFNIDKRIFVEAKFTTAPPPPPPPPPQQLTITVTKSGSGTGTVTDNVGMNCGAGCSSSVSAGTTITLKALPSSNSTFRNWSNGTGSAAVCNNSTTAICRFTLSQNSAIRANFDLTQ